MKTAKTVTPRWQKHLDIRKHMQAKGCKAALVKKPALVLCHAAPTGGCEHARRVGKGRLCFHPNARRIATASR